jgi:hypothetical protein
VHDRVVLPSELSTTYLHTRGYLSALSSIHTAPDASSMLTATRPGAMANSPLPRSGEIVRAGLSNDVIRTGGPVARPPTESKPRLQVEHATRRLPYVEDLSAV